MPPMPTIPTPGEFAEEWRKAGLMFSSVHAAIGGMPHEHGAVGGIGLP